MLHTDPSKRQYSYTALSQWMLCQRRYFWGYVRNLTLDVSPAAPHFGQAIHAALKVWYDTRDEEAMLVEFRKAYAGAPPDVLRTEGKGELILRGYIKKWGIEPFKVLSNEEEFSIPMPGGSTLIGRWDRVVEWDGRLLCKETKTTSSGVGASFFKGFSPNLQVDIVCYAVAKKYGRCDGILIDALQVLKTKEEYARDVQDRTPQDLERFLVRYQRIVHDIEETTAAHAIRGDRGHFLQNQLMCTYWGECPYRRLCLYDDDSLIEGHYKLRETKEDP